MKRTLLAVSGTLQCGFELRANLDHPEWTAVLVGSAVVRGVRAHLDMSPAAASTAHPPTATRASTGERRHGRPADANLYSVYLVHGRSCSRRSWRAALPRHRA